MTARRWRVVLTGHPLPEPREAHAVLTAWHAGAERLRDENLGVGDEDHIDSVELVDASPRHGTAVKVTVLMSASPILGVAEVIGLALRTADRAYGLVDVPLPLFDPVKATAEVIR